MVRRWTVCLAVGLVTGGTADAEPLRFNRDIRPILSDTCFKCHGPDAAKRATAMRLDDPASAAAEHDGKRPIVPGHPEASELVRRIRAADPSDRMPPPDSGLALTPAQAEALERWVAEGAVYEKHWSFVPPQALPPPAVAGAPWPRGAIDSFLLERLEDEGLEPSPEADREKLLRRAALDLTGLPPTVEEVDAFLADDAPDAYERRIDELLASPRFGERMVLEWLDAARYADTNGYQGDSTRSSWHWRDWAVAALNAGMPFDRFTIEQLAGDLLPGATQSQRVATGFHRNHMLNGEGGRIVEESRVDYVMDRVETTATVWLGLTFNCARCHNHKYDPIPQRDYYQLFAFFNNVPETGGVDAGGNANPVLRLRTPDVEAEIATLEKRIGELEARLRATDEAIDLAQSQWEKEQAPARVELAPWHAIGPFEDKDLDGAFARVFEPELGVELAAAYGEGKLRWIRHDDWADGKVQPLSGSACATYLYRTISCDRATPATLSLGSDDGIKVWVNGQQVFGKKLVRAATPDQDIITVRLEAGENRLLLKIVNGSGGYGYYFKLASAGTPADIAAIAQKVPTARDAGEAARLREFYRLKASPSLAPVAAEITAARARVAEIEANLPVTMVMQEMETPRDSFILVRGAYDKPGEKVTADVPAALPRLPTGATHDRLALARWIVSPENPLTARVTVNRQWELLFGTGLVKTTEDFGAQGEPPSHPELLDWLAADFERGWDLKGLQRRILSSAAYRQSSTVLPAHLEKDPQNRLLARAPRWRLNAHVLRDQALYLGGLLSTRMGGPPVRPYQPPGIWEEFSFGQIAYRQDQGESLYRRTLYTFWRRSVGPTMLFDTSARQVCTVRQSRTNTPLHALVLLNDVTYAEAARALAARMLKDAADPRQRLERAFRAATSRRPSPVELDVLLASLDELRERYRQDPEAARELARVGDSAPPAGVEPIELAAYAGVASLLLNLDETINRE